jgi:hypothetical protein
MKMEFTRSELYLLLNQPKPLWLNGADLHRADLSGADLYQANLRGAFYNEHTKFSSAEFDPVQAGMVFKQ